jgi:hypothetical protein
VGGFAGFVDNAEADVAQRAGQAPGPQHLRSTGVDQRCIQGFGEPDGDLVGQPAAVLLGQAVGGPHEIRDEIVAARCQFAQASTVTGQVRVAELGA